MAYCMAYRAAYCMAYRAAYRLADRVSDWPYRVPYHVAYHMAYSMVYCAGYHVAYRVAYRAYCMYSTYLIACLAYAAVASLTRNQLVSTDICAICEPSSLVPLGSMMRQEGSMQSSRP